VRLAACAALLLAAALAGCSGSGKDEETWAGPPEAAADGSVSVEDFAAYQEDLDTRWEHSAEMTAAEFLRLDERTSSRTTIDGKSNGEGLGPRVVMVTLDGLLDDSVRAERWLLLFEPEGENFKLTSAVRTIRCQRGRGHEDFTAEPCV
jgi:hypothetical protein